MARDKKDADASREHGGKAVEALIGRGLVDCCDRRGENRRPRQSQLPQFERALCLELVLVTSPSGPQGRQRNEKVADHPTGVQDAAERSV